MILSILSNLESQILHRWLSVGDSLEGVVILAKLIVHSFSLYFPLEGTIKTQIFTNISNIKYFKNIFSNIFSDRTLLVETVTSSAATRPRARIADARIILGEIVQF